MLRNFFSLVIMLALSSVSLADQSQSLTQRLFKPIIMLKCDQELSESILWKGASMLMSQQQRNDNQKAICQCVSEHAMDDMSVQDLAKATINEDEKNRLISKAIANSLRGCTKKILKP